MRQLLPEPVTSVDPYSAYGDILPASLRLNFVVSVDGCATDRHGWTDELGGDADMRVFRTLRALADAIIIGAGTIRSGRVGPHRPPEPLRARRVADGRSPTAPIVVVSRSLDLDWSHPLFTAAEAPTMVVTCARPVRPRTSVPSTVPVLVSGDDEVDLPQALARLRAEFRLDRLLCEGGPVLATRLLDVGVVDELCLSVAPVLVGVDHPVRLIGGLTTDIPMELTGAYHDRGVLFLRYRPSKRH